MRLKLNGRHSLAIVAILAALCIAAPQRANATDTVECDSVCDGGNKMVSYADGNTIACACVAESQMEPTVSDPEVVEGPVNPDVE